jgi:hypothetical protein
MHRYQFVHDDLLLLGQLLSSVVSPIRDGPFHSLKKDDRLRHDDNPVDENDWMMERRRRKGIAIPRQKRGVRASHVSPEKK